MKDVLKLLRAAACVMVFPLMAQATTIDAGLVSYSYVVGPNADRGIYAYPDDTYDGTTGQLSDGYATTVHWGASGEEPGGPNVGWYRVDPTIQFSFDQTYRFSEMVMNIQDTGGGAGVGIAEGINVNGLTAAITTTGAGGPVNLAFDLSALLPSDSLLVTVDPGHQWTFISEFTFSGTAVLSEVPLPAGLPMLLAGLGGLALVRLRRARHG